MHILNRNLLAEAKKQTFEDNFIINEYIVLRLVWRNTQPPAQLYTMPKEFHFSSLYPIFFQIIYIINKTVKYTKRFSHLHWQK